MLVRPVRWGWCLLGLWLLAPAVAAATGDELFRQGVGAFKAGDFTSALHYFREAGAAGLDLPTLHYNLGVSLYKLGRYAEAEREFRACARDRAWAPLASYNAGLSAYRRGEHALAADYFKRAWRTADSDKVRALALTMLARSGNNEPRSALTVNLGYNDNVTLTADSQTLSTSSQADRFTELLASVTGRRGKQAHALRWDASLYDLRYARLTDNNITSLAFGARKPITTAPWYTDVGLHGEYVLRDGHRFQQIASLQFGVAAERPNQHGVRLRLQFSTIDALDDNFGFLTGSQQELDASVARPVGRGRARLGITVERNGRADLATNGEFFSFSPTRYALWLSASWPLGRYWQLQPAARYTQSRYADPDRRASGVVATREDRERFAALRAAYRLTAVWHLHGEYTYIDNRSNFAEFAYVQRVVWIGVARRF